jgi:arsenical-resistance protein 2
MATTSQPGKSNVAPWYEAYPEPSTKLPEQLSRDELLDWMHHGKQAGKDFLVIDVRKLDHTVCYPFEHCLRLLIPKGGFLRGSLNLPIESLHPSLSTIYNICKNTSVDTVIWYCGQYVPKLLRRNF